MCVFCEEVMERRWGSTDIPTHADMLEWWRLLGPNPRLWEEWKEARGWLYGHELAEIALLEAKYLASAA